MSGVLTGNIVDFTLSTKSLFFNNETNYLIIDLIRLKNIIYCYIVELIRSGKRIWFMILLLEIFNKPTNTDLLQ